MSIFNDDHRATYDGNDDDDTPKKDDDENVEPADPGKPSYADPRIGVDYESAEDRPV